MAHADLLAHESLTTRDTLMAHEVLHAPPAPLSSAVLQDAASAGLGLADALGTAAALTMIVYTCLGLPMQVLANARRRSTQGLSLPMFAMSCLGFLLFTLYAFALDPIDWYLVAANVPGTLLTATILLQFWLFRGSDPDSAGT